MGDRKIKGQERIKFIINKTPMTTLNFTTSACRCCRYYQPEGRRGGMCQQLSVPVRGSWKACSLAISPFEPAWRRMEAIWGNDPLGIKESLAVNCSLTVSAGNLPEESGLSSDEALKARPVLAEIA
jgi:hypothetical protein